MHNKNFVNLCVVIYVVPSEDVQAPGSVSVLVCVNGGYRVLALWTSIIPYLHVYSGSTCQGSSALMPRWMSKLNVWKVGNALT